MQVNGAQVNYAGGLLSRKLLGRIDLPSYAIGLSICRNFLIEVQGPLTFRGGSRYALPTRGNAISALVPFVFNDEQAYALAFTAGKLRFLSDGGAITETAKNITGITKANPGVISSTGHGYSTGDQIYIDNISGMTELNGKFFLVEYIDANSYSLKNLDGVAINTSAYTTYVSGGTTERVYEITSPYAEADLFQLKYAQKADLMYIVHPDYEPRKLVRTAETSWTLATFTRTADPFTKAITGATQANPCAITATAHGLVTGDIVEIYGIGGMTELNGGTFTVNRTGADTFTLNGINSTGYTAYTSGGYLFKTGDMPGAAAFYGARVFYGGTNSDPETFWGSRSPDDDGLARYDDFTLGSNEDDAVVFPITSQNNTADRIYWFSGNNKFLAIGTFGAVYKAYGASEGNPITGTAVTVQPVDFYGCENIMPVRQGSVLYYLQRGGLILNKFAYDILSDGYSSEDLSILSDEITTGGIKQMALQQGNLNILWAVRNDGVLLGLSTKEQEKILAWHTHYIGGTDVKVLSVCGEPQPNNNDNLWLVVERTIDGITRRYYEYFTSDIVLPEREDIYTGDVEADSEKFYKLQYEAAKQLVRVDSALTLDTLQTVTITPGATTGTGITFTAGSTVFKTTDVGRRIIKKYLTGEESGIAEITSVTDPSNVVCTILEDFDSTSVVAANAWYLTTDTLVGLDHLEGETVRIVTDGAIHPDAVVVNGSVTLDYQASVIHVGLGYVGRVRTMPLEIGGLNGPAQSKVQTIDKVGFLFRNTLGVKFGSDEYKLEELLFRSTDDYTDRPPPLFSGIKQAKVKNGYDYQKFMNLIQDKALPCQVLSIIPYVSTTNE